MATALTVHAGRKSRYPVTLVFRPLFNGIGIIDTTGGSLLVSGDTFSIDQLRFYCSDLCLLDGEKIVWQDKVKSHLVDAGNS